MPNVRIAFICSQSKAELDFDNARCPVWVQQEKEMNDIPSETTTPAPESEPRKILPPAAQRALAEAEARRAAAAANTAAAAKEFQGPEGPEPTRFGDWERKGIASDF
jgi:hypothetical protein